VSYSSYRPTLNTTEDRVGESPPAHAGRAPPTVGQYAEGTASGAANVARTLTRDYGVVASRIRIRLSSTPTNRETIVHDELILLESG